MEKIKFDLEKFEVKKKGVPTSERAYWVDECAKLTGKKFNIIMGQTKQLTMEEIRDIYLKAKGWQKNPGALFWILLKEFKKKINV